MSDGVAQDQIRAFFERWQRLEEEKVAISGDLKELFAEAKANGFDTKVLRVVFRDKVADQNAKSEFEAVYDIYWSALGTPRATGAGRAHEDGTPDHDPVTGEIHEPEAAMLPQTAGSETAVAAGAPEGEHSPYASEPIRRMSMTPLEPREAGGLKGFGFTVRFDEPQPTIAAQGAATLNTSDPLRSDAAEGNGAGVAAPDHSQPNPICRDPDDCGVYASWAMPCEVCKAAAAHRSAA